MSIRTTVTLDEDVLERVKRDSAARGSAFRGTLNHLLRLALLYLEQKRAGEEWRSNPFTWDSERV